MLWGRVFKFQNWPHRRVYQQSSLDRPILKFERPTPFGQRIDCAAGLMKQCSYLMTFCYTKKRSFQLASWYKVFLPRIGNGYQPGASSSSSAALGYHHNIIGCPEGAQQSVQTDRKGIHFKIDRFPCPYRGLCFIVPIPQGGARRRACPGLISSALNRA